MLPSGAFRHQGRQHCVGGLNLGVVQQAHDGDAFVPMVDGNLLAVEVFKIFIQVVAARLDLNPRIKKSEFQINN
tara:strand:+ start:3251 stop:3472 length:222 start_codon:yes stop_codon:yes gene_type:complete